MKSGIYFIQISLLFFIIASCQQSGERDNNDLTPDENIIHLTPSEDTLLLDLQPLLENRRVIQLDNDPDALTTYINPVSVKGGSLIIGQRGRPLMDFDEKQGNYIGEIGSRGNAPGEYRGVKNISLKPTGNMLAIQPTVKDNPILIYDISPGEMQMVMEIVNPEDWTHTGVLWNRKDQLLIRYINAEEDRTQIQKLDIDGNILDSVFMNEKKGVSPISGIITDADSHR